MSLVCTPLALTTGTNLMRFLGQQVNASWTDDQMSIYSYLENADLAGDHAMFLQTAISFDPSEFGSSGQLA